MIIKLDFSEIPDNSVPAGTYQARVKNLIMKQTKAGDNMMSFQFDIIGGDQAGRSSFFNLVLMEKTMWKVQETFKSFDFGMQVELEVQVDPQGAQRVTNPEFFDKTVSIVLVDSEYKGAKRTSVEKVLPAVTGGII